MEGPAAVFLRWLRLLSQPCTIPERHHVAASGIFLYYPDTAQYIEPARLGICHATVPHTVLGSATTVLPSILPRILPSTLQTSSPDEGIRQATRRHQPHRELKDRDIINRKIWFSSLRRVFLEAAGEDSGDVPLDAELWDAAFVPGEVPPAPLPPMPEAAPAGPLAGGYLSPAVTAAADGAAHPPPAPQRPGAHFCRGCVSPLKAAAMSKPHLKLHCVLGCLMVPSVPAVSIGSGHQEPVHLTAIPLTRRQPTSLPANVNPNLLPPVHRRQGARSGARRGRQAAAAAGVWRRRRPFTSRRVVRAQRGADGGAAGLHCARGRCPGVADRRPAHLPARPAGTLVELGYGFTAI